MHRRDLGAMGALILGSVLAILGAMPREWKNGDRQTMQ